MKARSHRRWETPASLWRHVDWNQFERTRAFSQARCLHSFGAAPSPGQPACRKVGSSSTEPSTDRRMSWRRRWSGTSATIPKLPLRTTITPRDVARGLAWLGIGPGLAELLASRAVAASSGPKGHERPIQAFGPRDRLGCPHSGRERASVLPLDPRGRRRSRRCAARLGDGTQQRRPQPDHDGQHSRSLR